MVGHDEVGPKISCFLYHHEHATFVDIRCCYALPMVSRALVMYATGKSRDLGLWEVMQCDHTIHFSVISSFFSNCHVMHMCSVYCTYTINFKNSVKKWWVTRVLF